MKKSKDEKAAHRYAEKTTRTNMNFVQAKIAFLAGIKYGRKTSLGAVKETYFKDAFMEFSEYETAIRELGKF